MVRVMPLRCGFYPIGHFHSSASSRDHYSVFKRRTEYYIVERVRDVACKHSFEEFGLGVVKEA